MSESEKIECYEQEIRNKTIEEYQHNLLMNIIAWQEQNESDDKDSYEHIVHETLETVLDAVNGIAWQMKEGMK